MRKKTLNGGGNERRGKEMEEGSWIKGGEEQRKRNERVREERERGGKSA